MFLLHDEFLAVVDVHAFLRGLSGQTATVGAIPDGGWSILCRWLVLDGGRHASLETDSGNGAAEGLGQTLVKAGLVLIACGNEVAYKDVAFVQVEIDHVD